MNKTLLSNVDFDFHHSQKQNKQTDTTVTFYCETLTL